MSVFGDLNRPSTGWVPSSTNLGWTYYGPIGVYPYSPGYYPNYTPSPCPSCGHCPTCGRHRPVPYTFPNTWTGTTDTITITSNGQQVGVISTGEAAPSPDVQVMMEYLRQQAAVSDAPTCPSAESGDECEHD